VQKKQDGRGVRGGKIGELRGPEQFESMKLVTRKARPLWSAMQEPAEPECKNHTLYKNLPQKTRKKSKGKKADQVPVRGTVKRRPKNNGRTIRRFGTR